MDTQIPCVCGTVCVRACVRACVILSRRVRVFFTVRSLTRPNAKPTSGPTVDHERSAGGSSDDRPRPAGSTAASEVRNPAASAFALPEGRPRPRRRASADPLSSGRPRSMCSPGKRGRYIRMQCIAPLRQAQLASSTRGPISIARRRRRHSLKLTVPGARSLFCSRQDTGRTLHAWQRIGNSGAKLEPRVRCGETS
jgi:hypothetical protein